MLGDILGFLAIFLLSWLGVGCGLVYLINIFRFQMPFSRTMVQEGVYDVGTHKSVLTSKWVGALVTLLLSGGLTAFLILRAQQPGYMHLLMPVLGVLVGVFRSRHLLTYQKGNVCRFVRTHIVCMDRKKTEAFLRREYDLELSKLVPSARK